MERRIFLQLAAVAAVAGMSVAGRAAAADDDAAAFVAARRHALLPQGRIAYVEQGSGPAALFLHGAPLNGYQWRGALARLSGLRRCIAPDFMGLGYTEVPAAQALDAAAQLDMLLALLDALGVAQADVVASDSGGAVAQLLLARHPQRVRSLLLTNCDVEPDSPPAGVQPAIALAREGKLADATAQWLTDRDAARRGFGAAVFHDPATLTDAAIEAYVRPLVASPLRREQYHRFHLALEPNPLAGVAAGLRRSTAPVRIVWGGADTIFSLNDARYLDRLFPRSQGMRVVAEGKLFFPEEYPDLIAQEARRLWAAA